LAKLENVAIVDEISCVTWKLGRDKRDIVRFTRDCFSLKIY